MKLIVQIPCYNEAETLPTVVREIPREVEGFEDVEILVIDDGSEDGTADVARELDIDHLVVHRRNQGLARAFRAGLEACLKLGADVIVNTDGDNQYPGGEIPRLTEPILRGDADIVIGNRQPGDVEHFSAIKRRLQALGSFIVGRLSGTEVPDAVSGFRALSREAALHLNILSPFSYTIEMLIQAGDKHLEVASVPIDVNPVTRTSRLARSTAHFVSRSAATMIRVYSMFRPLRTFFWLGIVVAMIGAVPIVRFLYLWSIGQGAGHIQSLVLGGVLVLVGYMTLLIGLVADLISFNRKLVELMLQKLRRLETRTEASRGATGEGTTTRRGERRSSGDRSGEGANLRREAGMAESGGQEPPASR